MTYDSKFCQEYDIAHRFTSMGHSQANGEAKLLIGILQGLKVWLG